MNPSLNRNSLANLHVNDTIADSCLNIVRSYHINVGKTDLPQHPLLRVQELQAQDERSRHFVHECNSELAAREQYKFEAPIDSLDCTHDLNHKGLSL
jgi:hypothetical protein